MAPVGGRDVTGRLARWVATDSRSAVTAEAVRVANTSVLDVVG
jgi:hypothetical protein